MRRAFSDAGFPAADIQVVGPTPKNRNLVVRYRGSGRDKKPILLLAHLDVVEAKREDWTYDPFKFTETDGYFYGRGTQDQKGGAATLATTLAAPEGREATFPTATSSSRSPPAKKAACRTTASSGCSKNKKSLIDAEYTINVDAGGGEMENGKHTLFDVQAAEKVFHSVSLTVRESRRPQLAAAQGQRDLCACAAALERICRRSTFRRSPTTS